ncbi:MAG: hypothetical protein A2W25_13540 [candidate division Zixibacteria bacterium RBG_16_53_22]|nr:MAG: hypothetical protein A2W25_13540 [candidate division Zixibacteria bacterium RBG_16_53_22]
MKILIILNDPPYGTERSYNGMRLAISLSKVPNSELKVFLLADAVSCGKSGQATPNGYYNLERMLKSLVSRKVAIGACGSCMDARGSRPEEMIQGVHKSSMEELTEWTVWADKVIVF